MLATAKIHILKQFTTSYLMIYYSVGLCLLLQRYTFWSNSQRAGRWILPFRIVLATAKIHILKQFTTSNKIGRGRNWLCLLLQRYTFWSNSQPMDDLKKLGKILCLLLQRYTFWSNSQLVNFKKVNGKYCACYCKDTHFEAIHNPEVTPPGREAIVLATAKIHILKQFTTSFQESLFLLGLCLLLQRYTFWSNSQRNWLPQFSTYYCACYCKDTHFEAIHNVGGGEPPQRQIVLATAKIHILKQFTTTRDGYFFPEKLCLLLQRYTFWSNSQHIVSHPVKAIDCACYCKDTHFEAIHNLDVHFEVVETIVLATAKIHILKQFTTVAIKRCRNFKLCLLLQRYTFWSNSQLRQRLNV